nr:hypothetical protein [Lachnospiraceae bacterium]
PIVPLGKEYGLSAMAVPKIVSRVCSILFHPNTKCITDNGTCQIIMEHFGVFLVSCFVYF